MTHKVLEYQALCGFLKKHLILNNHLIPFPLVILKPWILLKSLF